VDESFSIIQRGLSFICDILQQTPFFQSVDIRWQNTLNNLQMLTHKTYMSHKLSNTCASNNKKLNLRYVQAIYTQKTHTKGCEI
jgi:hypothetical protein